MTGDETSTQAQADDVLRRLLREADVGDLTEPSMARVRALELLGMHLGMFPDRVEVTIGRGNDGMQQTRFGSIRWRACSRPGRLSSKRDSRGATRQRRRSKDASGTAGRMCLHTITRT